MFFLYLCLAFFESTLWKYWCFGPILWLCCAWWIKAQPHAAMLHTCDGVLQSTCDAGKYHAMHCDVNSNMFNILLLILEYLSYSLSDFQKVCNIVMTT